MTHWVDRLDTHWRPDEWTRGGSSTFSCMPRSPIQCVTLQCRQSCSRTFGADFNAKPSAARCLTFQPGSVGERMVSDRPRRGDAACPQAQEREAGHASDPPATNCEHCERFQRQEPEATLGLRLARVGTDALQGLLAQTIHGSSQKVPDFRNQASRIVARLAFNSGKVRGASNIGRLSDTE